MADGITRIAVEGFKSIARRQEIEIAPLTILAGANSSGKSSIMQPLLMLKQTLEAPYDPGPLKLDGPNVSFTSADQFLSKTGNPSSARLAIEVWIDTKFKIAFQKDRAGIQVAEQTTVIDGELCVLRPGMSSEEIAKQLRLPDLQGLPGLRVVPNRFLLGVAGFDMPYASGAEWVALALRTPIHVRGLRGSSSRTHPVAAVDPIFPGLFEPYVASIIGHWQAEGSEQARALDLDLQHIGLARRVFAKRHNEAEMDLQVSRDSGGTNDTVSIADVGFGVSQVLPVLVALRAAGQGRLVYLEEPEIHLHPRAQTKLADILADAAKRGVRVVAETHSSLLLRAIQTLVAKGDLDPDLVWLHWFIRDADGVTKVSSAKPDTNGAFGAWPEDFGDVALESEQKYLDAVEDRLTH